MNAPNSQPIAEPIRCDEPDKCPCGYLWPECIPVEGGKVRPECAVRPQPEAGDERALSSSVATPEGGSNA